MSSTTVTLTGSLEVPDHIVGYHLDAPYHILPIDYEDDDQNNHLLYARLAPYLPFKMKQLLAVSGMRYTGERDKMVLKPTFTGEACKGFFAEHFRGFEPIGMELEDGSLPTPEQQMQWVDSEDSRRSIKRTVITQGYNVFVISNKAPAKKLVLKLGAVERKVKLRKLVYDPVVKGLVQLEMTHVLRKENEKDNSDYTQATSQSEIETREQPEWSSIEDLDTIERLYDDMVKRAEGVYIGNLPCSEANKADWVKLIPFVHKRLVLRENFRSIQVRNF